MSSMRKLRKQAIQKVQHARFQRIVDKVVKRIMAKLTLKLIERIDARLAAGMRQFALSCQGATQAIKEFGDAYAAAHRNTTAEQ